MRRRPSKTSRTVKAGFISMAVLAAGLAFAPSCASKPPVRAAALKPEPVDVDFLFNRKKRSRIISQKDRTIARVANEAGLNPRDIRKLSGMRTKVYTVRVGDSVSIWPGETPINATKIDSKEITFSDGTRLICGENYHYIDVKLHVLVSNMNSTDRSVMIVVAKDKPGGK